MKLEQFRYIPLLSVEGKIFFSILSRRLNFSSRMHTLTPQSRKVASLAYLGASNTLELLTN